MSTLNKQLCEAIIANGGVYPGDEHLPPTAMVITYNNQFNGGLEWATIREDESPTRYEDSSACKNVQVYWTRGVGLNKDWNGVDSVRSKPTTSMALK